MDNFSDRIRMLVFKKKISLELLASNIGMSRPGLYKAMKNNKFKTNILQRIADYFEVELSYFYPTMLNEESKRDREIIEELKIKNQDLEKTIIDKADLNTFKDKEIASLTKYKNYFEKIVGLCPFFAKERHAGIIWIREIDDDIKICTSPLAKEIDEKEYQQIITMEMLK